MTLLCVVQIVEAGDWVQVTVQFTKLSMHVSVAPASAVGRRRRAQQHHAQPEPQDVWEEEMSTGIEVAGASATDESEVTSRNLSWVNESRTRQKRSGWVWLDT